MAFWNKNFLYNGLKGGQTRGVMSQEHVAAEKTCVLHTEATRSRDVYQGQNHNMCTHMKIVWVHVPGICCSDMAAREK